MYDKLLKPRQSYWDTLYYDDIGLLLHINFVWQVLYLYSALRIEGMNIYLSAVCVIKWLVLDLICILIHLCSINLAVFVI